MPFDPTAVQLLSREHIDECAWNACVSAASNRLVYSFTWYLDAVLPAPDWRWMGLVLFDEAGGYQVVMPVPLRRKGVDGFTYAWVVHQPFFCPLLDVFGPATIEPDAFFQVIQQRFRYGSRLQLTTRPALESGTVRVGKLATHVLNLSAGYEQIRAGYTPGRRLNLRRAIAANWTMVDGSDLKPLLRLFRDNHAAGIPGGVAMWAYDMLRSLYDELHRRGLVTLRYAIRNDRIEAGALFVRDGNRIIYLFNAASDVGRRGNARTLLIDQFIREQAGQPLLFDFESPEKPSIVAFYRSFGAVETPYWAVRWGKLTRTEKLVSALLRRFRRCIR